MAEAEKKRTRGWNWHDAKLINQNVRERRNKEELREQYDQDQSARTILQSGDDVRIYGEWMTFFRHNLKTGKIEAYRGNELVKSAYKDVFVPEDHLGALLRRGDLVRNHNKELGQIRFFLPRTKRAEVYFLEAGKSRVVNIVECQKLLRFQQRQCVWTLFPEHNQWYVGRIEKQCNNTYRVSWPDWGDSCIPDPYLQPTYQKFLENQKVEVWGSSEEDKPLVRINSYESWKDLYQVKRVADGGNFEVFSHDILSEENPSTKRKARKLQEEIQDDAPRMMDTLERIFHDPEWRATKEGQKAEHEFRKWIHHFNREAKKIRNKDVYGGIFAEDEEWRKFLKDEAERKDETL